MSMKPGQTAMPEASIVRPASTFDTSPSSTVTVSPSMPRAARNQARPAPSITFPFTMSVSNMRALPVG